MKNEVTRLEEGFMLVERTMKRALMQLQKLGYEPEEHGDHILTLGLQCLSHMEASVKADKTAASQPGKPQTAKPQPIGVHE